MIEFNDKLISLFGSWNVVYDIAGGDGNIVFKDIINKINKVLIKN